MQSIESIADSPFSQNPNNSSSSSVNGLYGWLFECHGFWHNLALIIPSLLFALFLGFQAKKSFQKLSHGRSYIMISYYGSLWLVSLLNLAWCSLQAWECTPGKEMVWNILSLFTTSGMLFLEVSLVAFLLQGNYTSGLEALTRTFVVSGLIVGLDLLLKVFLLLAIYLFGFGVPLFIDNTEHPHQVKWGLWVVHRLVLTAIYGFILFMYHSKWRERLPARPAFYKYVAIMFILNALALIACGLTGNGCTAPQLFATACSMYKYCYGNEANNLEFALALSFFIPGINSLSLFLVLYVCIEQLGDLSSDG
ncbi:Uncharacterized protein TCM_025954 isoform 5 [Theobroma cacao]|uniref:Uncharacterized protein isoform 5 n=1 Tax=Theobroma cacao TaxID=3641 RepID=A0A061EZX7_THECC|nr:Uncharacterized protein TCM_025954 isoform 5 [Theobroma cacao]